MLGLREIRDYCGKKMGAVEDFPFDFSTLVFKVGGKMFALMSIDAEPVSVNLKCDPFLSLELRARYPQVTPGYHMNKKHWNTLLVDGAIPDDEVLRLIDHSYDLVARNPKKGSKR